MKMLTMNQSNIGNWLYQIFSGIKKKSSIFYTYAHFVYNIVQKRLYPVKFQYLAKKEGSGKNGNGNKYYMV